MITCSTHLTFKTLIQPPFDQLELQNDNEKVKFYIGLIIHEGVMFQEAQLAIPAFNKGNDQLDLVDVKKTRGIANARIHVERVIGLLFNLQARWT